MDHSKPRECIKCHRLFKHEGVGRPPRICPSCKQSPAPTPPVVSRNPVSTWPSQSEARSLLNVSRASIRRLVEAKLLVAIKDDHGEWRFRPEELEREVAKRTERRSQQPTLVTTEAGKLAAHAFKLFRERGVDLRVAVEEMAIEFSTAQRLATDYHTAGNSVLLVLTPEALAQLRLLFPSWIGTDVTSLLAAANAEIKSIEEKVSNEIGSIHDENEKLLSETAMLRHENKRLTEELSNAKESSRDPMAAPSAKRAS